MFNQKVRPRYLMHEAATVVEVDDRSVLVRLWRPVGRFRDGVVLLSALALHKLGNADDRTERCPAALRPATCNVLSDGSASGWQYTQLGSRSADVKVDRSGSHPAIVER